ncbi:MAG: VPLPA-CTERM sorting domain-containing protein [Gammaproteobacteria bacterium]
MRQQSSFRFGCMLAAAGVAVSLAAPLASAATIIATPQETGGGFLHNVFHSANANGGASGTIWAWVDLDTSYGASNDWNAATGALEIHVNIYADSALTSLQGTAVGTSANLLGANFSAPNAQNGGLLGNIVWDFDAAALAYLQSKDAAITDLLSQAFVDRNYVTSANGFQANSLANNSVTLWGADSAALLNTNTSGSNFDTATTILGTDLVFTVVPVPAAVWLFGSGLAVLGAVRRRRTA